MSDRRVTIALERLDRDELVARQGERLTELLSRIYGRNRVLHAQARRGGHPRGRAAVSRRPAEAAVHHQGRVDRRPGRESAVGHGAHRADRALHALLPDFVDHGPAALLDRHERELAVDARLLEDGLPRRGRQARAIACSFRFRSVRFSASGPASRPAARLGLHCVPGGGMSSQQRSGDDRGDRRDGGLLHADLRAAAGRGGRSATARDVRSPRAGCAC